MTDIGRDNLDLREEDRLPWLEAVEDERSEEGISPMKLAATALGVLLALGLLVAAFYFTRGGGEGSDGGGALIAAPEGGYKVRPDEPGGMKVEGEGDASFAASEGAEATGKLDTAALPETPVEAVRAPAPARREAKVVASGSARVADGGRMPAAGKAPAIKASAAVARGSVVQLGAYNSEAVAASAWKRMSGRFAFLGNYQNIIVPVKVGGDTLYRLRVDAGSSGEARDVCGRLKVAGENCLIAVN